MLEVGKSRAPVDANLSWMQANAEELPFEDNSFDLYTISFGIRNVPDKDKALKEAYRVLVPGGRFMCLEFSKVTNPVLAELYNLHSAYYIPNVGQLVANDRESYVYLVESIQRFPSQEEFAFMISKAGFSSVTHRDLTWGIAAIHSGVKLD
jgi:demethylmenaquinone methyltransferase/2-methoxy-6-polyprenyl-1,4-benzoquinol methylase